MKNRSKINSFKRSEVTKRKRSPQFYSKFSPKLGFLYYLRGFCPVLNPFRYERKQKTQQRKQQQLSNRLM